MVWILCSLARAARRSFLDFPTISDEKHDMLVTNAATALFLLASRVADSPALAAATGGNATAAAAGTGKGMKFSVFSPVLRAQVDLLLLT